MLSRGWTPSLRLILSRGWIPSREQARDRVRGPEAAGAQEDSSQTSRS